MTRSIRDYKKDITELLPTQSTLADKFRLIDMTLTHVPSLWLQRSSWQAIYITTILLDTFREKLASILKVPTDEIYMEFNGARVPYGDKLDDKMVCTGFNLTASCWKYPVTVLTEINLEFCGKDDDFDASVLDCILRSSKWTLLMDNRVKGSENMDFKTAGKYLFRIRKTKAEI